MKTQRLWKKFPDLTEKIKQDHIAQKVFGGGHDFYHALTVAQYASLISETEHVGILSWVAGMCHNTDRMFPKEEVRGRILEYLESADIIDAFNDREKTLVLEAVLDHGKRNDLKDNPVTVALKDADRLGNVGQLHWLRSAQFRPHIVAVDPRFILETDSEATFKDPRTIVHDIKETLVWESWLRLPKARALGKPMFEASRRFIEDIAASYQEIDLYPMPPELIVEIPY